MTHPPATATGTFESTPLPQLLVYASERKLTGSFAFFDGTEEVAWVTLDGGEATNAKVPSVPLYLGQLLYELGHLDAEQLGASLAELARGGALHGELLVKRGVVSQGAVEKALGHQIFRKAHHLFSLPSSTGYAFYAQYDVLRTWGRSGGARVGLLPLVWRGIKENPPMGHVEGILKRIEGRQGRIQSREAIARLALDADEEEAAALMLQRPLSRKELVLAAAALEPKRATLLYYTLVLTKTVTLVGETVSSAAFAAPSTSIMGMSAVRPQSGEHRRPEAAPVSAPSPPISVPRAPSQVGLPRVPSQVGLPRAPSQVGLPKVPSEVGIQMPPSPGGIPTSPSQVGIPKAPSQVGIPKPPSQGGIPRPPSQVGIPKPPSQGGIPKPPSIAKAFEMEATGNATEDLARSRLCLARGDLVNAERLARAVYRGAPNDPTPLALLASIELARPVDTCPDAWRTAFGFAQRALTIDGSHVEALTCRARVHVRAGNGAYALADLKRAVAAEPGNIDAARELRLVEMRLRNGTLPRRSATPSGGSKATAPGRHREEPEASTGDAATDAEVRRLLAQAKE